MNFAPALPGKLCGDDNAAAIISYEHNMRWISSLFEFIGDDDAEKFQASGDARSFAIYRLFDTFARQTYFRRAFQRILPPGES